MLNEKAKFQKPTTNMGIFQKMLKLTGITSILRRWSNVGLFYHEENGWSRRFYYYHFIFF